MAMRHARTLAMRHPGLTQGHIWPGLGSYLAWIRVILGHIRVYDGHIGLLGPWLVGRASWVPPLSPDMYPL